MVKLAPPGQVTGRRRLGLLPAEPASLVGREAELPAISALLTSARLVTLTGPAGVGKTRAALRAAACAAGLFPDGTWLVDLSELRDPGLLLEAVAVAIGVPDADADADAGSDWLRAAVLDQLRDRRLLLILDTCEHLLDACAAFAETVLSEAGETGGVTVLTTSRQPLDAPGEHVFRLPPLGTDDDAVELLGQRAAAAMPGFEVTRANRADAVRLCRRLDGIPLAIELAAVRLRALPLPDLADRLEAGFGVLAAGRRGTTGRHQTLRSAMAWSHDLCTPEEQLLWWRLSVFGGPFDVAAAEEVCSGGALPRERVIHALIGLVDKSVVLGASPGFGAGSGESGYRLPAAVRAFGAEKLATQSGDATGDDDGRAPVLDRLTAALEHTLGDARRPAPEVVAAPPGGEARGRVTSGLAATSVSVSARLTRREQEIAGLVASGLSNREIAAQLVISRRTVDAHVEHIFGKLQISSRVQLTVWLASAGREPAGLAAGR